MLSIRPNYNQSNLALAWENRRTYATSRSMKVTIIGAGAAGLMAAATLLEQAPATEVVLVDRNDGLGKKVIISGGGRCNVTTGLFDVTTVLTKYPRGSKFLASAIHRFPPQAVYDWFEAHGVPLKTEKDLRVFPVSDDGHDVVGVFENIFKSHGLKPLLKAQVLKVEKTADQFLVTTKGQTEPLVSDALVLTTGGQAYRHTGSTGDGYAFALSLGHTITTLAPSLNAFFTAETWVSELAGLSFAHATITTQTEPRRTFTGPFLFTHKGVSGPAVFALSSLCAFATYTPQAPLHITIDLLPQNTIPVLTQQLNTFILENPKKNLNNALAILVPKSLCEILIRELALPGTKHATEISKQELAQALAWLKALPLRIVARGAGDEFVTAGGVNLKEVNPSTMESKICPGLYLAGEILDIDGFTGGFNLQASWATGYVVGDSLAAKI